MSSTHLSLYYHFVFSTKNRYPWIHGDFEERLHQYMGGILLGLGAIPETIGGMPDHIHVATVLKATHRISDVLRELKACSSAWIHDVIGQRLFGWQDGYGAFTVGKMQLSDLKKYIREQKAHHAKKTFQDEYLEILNQNGITFDEKYLW